MSVLKKVVMTYLKAKVISSLVNFYGPKIKGKTHSETVKFLTNVGFLVYSPILLFTSLVALAFALDLNINGNDPIFAFSVAAISFCMFLFLLIKPVRYFRAKNKLIRKVKHLDDPISTFFDKILSEINKERKK